MVAGCPKVYGLCWKEDVMVAPANVALSSGDERTLIYKLTHEVLDATAPEETPQFEAAADEYLDHPGQVISHGSDEMLGSALEIIIPLTPYAVAAATAVVRFFIQVFSDAAAQEFKPVVAGWIHRLIHHEPEAPESVSVPPSLMKKIREVAVTVCQEMGADESDTALVADAIIGRLTVT